MKMVKKLLSAGVITAMALSVGMVANAEDTTVTADAITIDSVAFSAVEGDDTLVKATIGFTAVTPEEVTILMATQDSITVDSTDDIMYINQVANPESGVLEFIVEKSRILASTEASDVNNTTMYVKMGGTDIDTMASKTGVIVLEEDYMAGDVDGNGKLRPKDGTCALQLIAGWTVEEVQAKAGATAKINAKAADVDGNGKLRPKDGTVLLQAIAGWEVELKKPAN